jgi:hypothetical protein
VKNGRENKRKQVKTKARHQPGVMLTNYIDRKKWQEKQNKEGRNYTQ